MASQAYPSEFTSGDAVVLPPDVNGVILENLTALVGPATGALLDSMPAAGEAPQSRGRSNANEVAGDPLAPSPPLATTAPPVVRPAIASGRPSSGGGGVHEHLHSRVRGNDATRDSIQRIIS